MLKAICLNNNFNYALYSHNYDTDGIYNYEYDDEHNMITIRTKFDIGFVFSPGSWALNHFLIINMEDL